MYSNRYVALHCCQEKYFNEIKINGISRETKAVFISDLENFNKNDIYNTLAVLFYHGIGIDGWTKMLSENKKMNEIDKNLIIAMAMISKEQENGIQNNSICNYYKIIDINERTLDYCKIKDIGTIKPVIYTEKQELYNVNIKNFENINFMKDRFFVKNTYNSFEINNKNSTASKIKEICYKMADEKIKIIIDNILNIKKHKWMV